MAKKMTKQQRIYEKMVDGLSLVEAEIEIAREDADEKIARLRRRQEREQKRIDARAVEIIERDHAELWAEAQRQARVEIEAERDKRSAARRRAAAAPTPDAQQPAHDGGYDFSPGGGEPS